MKKIVVIEDDQYIRIQLIKLLGEKFPSISIVSFVAIDEFLFGQDIWKDADLFIIDGSFPLSCNTKDAVNRIANKFPHIYQGYNNEELSGGLITRELRKMGYESPVFIFTNISKDIFPEDIWQLPQVCHWDKWKIRELMEMIKKIADPQNPAL